MAGDEHPRPPEDLPLGVRLLRTLRGHDGPLGEIAWSPDGERIVTASKDATARIWEAGTGACLHVLEGHTSGLRGAAFDAHGAMVATGSDDGTARLWDASSGQPVRTLRSGTCNGVAFSPRDALLATANDHQARLWHVRDGTPAHELSGHTGYVIGIDFDPSGGRVATVGYDRVVRVYDVASGELLRSFEGHSNNVLSVTFHPGGRLLASAAVDLTVQLWDSEQGVLLRRLEGHTGDTRSVSFSADGRLLASKGMDAVRLWEAETGRPLATLPETGDSVWMPTLAFHPSRALLATVGTEGVADGDGSDRVVHIWELEMDSLLAPGDGGSVTYASAKIVLVGDSGVGKTGLGWRLAHDHFKEHASTHGQQFWLLDQLRDTRADGAECEAILWDLAGQPDYRLIHALFLDDADVALVLFDPTRDEDPLHGVEYWLRHLGVRPGNGGGPAAILVAARTDRGTGRLTAEEIETFCAQRGVRAYVPTSALRGDGLDALIEDVRAAIPWQESPTTVTTETFKRIKDFVLALKEQGRADELILSPDELRARLEGEGAAPSFSDRELLSAVGHLSNHGYVTRLKTSRGEPKVLLAPEILNNVASSLVLQARGNPRGLGSLEEEQVLSGAYHFPELEPLPPADREVLLDSAVARFLDHNVCLRETDPLTSRAYLVFPELINLKKPEADDGVEIEDGSAYTASGAVTNVYASLVVLLGYTSTFTRTSQWRDHARYEFGDGLVCGFRLEASRAGELDFVLYSGRNVGAPIRTLFQSLFESFLSRRRGLALQRFDPVTCSNGHQLNRAVVREQLALGSDHAFCGRCGERLALPRSDAPIELTADASAESAVADGRSRFERALFRLKAYVTQEGLAAPECFISYAWGDPVQEHWVEHELATDLTKSGIATILDRWENARIGASVPRFLERVAAADSVIVVGTPRYRTKYDNGEPMRGFVVAAEGDLIGKRMIGSEASKLSVLPVLLEGADDSVFPPLLQGRVYADFRRPARYFLAVFDVILSLYAIAPQDPIGSELRALVRGPS